MTEEPIDDSQVPIQPPAPMAANLPLDPSALSGAATDVPAQPSPSGSGGFLPNMDAPPLPQRPIGTSVAAQPVDRKQMFRQMLGDFLFSVGKGLAGRGEGPGADARGAGAAITAIPDRNIAQQQLQIQREQAQAASQYKEAQAASLTPSISMVDPQGNTVMVPPAHVGQALAAQYRLAGTTQAATTRANAAQNIAAGNNKTAKEVAGIKADSAETIASEKAAANKQLSAEKLNMMRQVLQNTKDNQKARLDLARQGFGMRQQEFAQKQDALSGPAQKTLMETTPVHDQIKNLIAQFEPMKDDNTPAKFMVERAKYAAGMQSPIGSASDTIAQLELNKIVGAARVLKGGSRAIQALQMAMTHLPNVWIDSPKLIHSKLENLDGALQQVEDAAYTYGKKTGVVPPSGTGSSLAKAKGGGGKYSSDNPFK